MIEIGPDLKSTIEMVIAGVTVAAIRVLAYNWRMTKTAKYEFRVDEEKEQEKEREGN